MKDFNWRTQQALYRYGLFVYQGKKFSRKCYSLLGLYPKDPWDEWEILYDPGFWVLIETKKNQYHPDVSKRKTSFALLGHIEEQLKKRKKDLAIWHLGNKPEYISVIND